MISGRRFPLVRLLACLALLLALQPPAPAVARPLPTKKQWQADVRAAMRGSDAWLDRRVERGGRRLAIVMDIDNTAIASHYSFPDPVRRVLRFADHARSEGVTLFFATARRQSQLTAIKRVLRTAGYRFDAVCGRHRSESIPHGKQRCRRQFERHGYTVIAMVGNRSTDFEGGHYERAFRLPSYRNKLN